MEVIIKLLQTRYFIVSSSISLLSLNHAGANICTYNISRIKIDLQFHTKAKINLVYLIKKPVLFFNTLYFYLPAHIRDPNNVLHSIHNLKITVKDLNTPPPQQAVARKMMTDTVASAQPQLLDGNQRNVISVGDYDLQLSGKLQSYYEVYMRG